MTRARREAVYGPGFFTSCGMTSKTDEMRDVSKKIGKRDRGRELALIHPGLPASLWTSHASRNQRPRDGDWPGGGNSDSCAGARLGCRTWKARSRVPEGS